MLLKTLSILILISLQYDFGNSAKILFYGAVGTHSTRISQWPLMEALAEKGHSVTYLSAFSNFEIDPKSKVKTYEPKKWKEACGPWEDKMDYYTIRKNRGLIDWIWTDLFETGKQACEVLYSDPDFIKWVKTSKFDLVIVETVVNECAFGMTWLWKSKFALYWTSTIMPWFQDAYGLPDESSSTSEFMFGFTSSDKMSFFQRFASALSPIVVSLMREHKYLPKLEEITRKGLGDDAKDMPSFREIEKNASLLFITSHYSLDDVRSLPPNTIPIGGNVVSRAKKPMPTEMENFINESPSGFIFISFGTVCDFTGFDPKVQVEFINALRKFPDMRFVWKSGAKINATTVPDNVFVAKWAPQQTLLGHPKIKAFISHAGMGSTAEAVHFSVPLVLVPVLADQDLNAKMIMKKGAGIKVEIVDMKMEHLEHAIKEILHNKKYRNAMTTLSKVFHDRPMPPLESAVWWVEYLLRHDQSINDFIIPPNVHQPWWKRRQIDVWITAGFLLAIIASMPILAIYYIVKKVFNQKSNMKVKKN